MGREGAREREGKAGCGQRGQQASEHARQSKERGREGRDCSRAISPPNVVVLFWRWREGGKGREGKAAPLVGVERAGAGGMHVVHQNEGRIGRTDDTRRRIDVHPRRRRRLPSFPPALPRPSPPTATYEYFPSSFLPSFAPSASHSSLAWPLHGARATQKARIHSIPFIRLRSAR